MNECPVGQVMKIHSAETGISPLCVLTLCTRSTDVPARLCNERRSCSISQEILVYPQHSPLCFIYSRGTFITIEFTCVLGTTLLILLSAVLNLYGTQINRLSYRIVQKHQFSNIIIEIFYGFEYLIALVGLSNLTSFSGRRHTTSRHNRVKQLNKILTPYD